MLYHQKIRTTFTCVSWLLSKGKQAKYTAFTGKLNNIFHFLKACIERNSNIYYRNQTCPPLLIGAVLTMSLLHSICFVIL